MEENGGRRTATGRPKYILIGSRALVQEQFKMNKFISEKISVAFFFFNPSLLMRLCGYGYRLSSLNPINIIKNRRHHILESLVLQRKETIKQDQKYHHIGLYQFTKNIKHRAYYITVRPDTYEKNH